MTNVFKRLLALSAFAVSVMVLLATGFRRGLISQDFLVICILVLGLVIFVWGILIVVKSTKEFATGSIVANQGRKQQLIAIRIGKVSIVVLALALILGLRQDAPSFVLAIGAIINFGLITVIFRIVIRLQKSIK